MSLVWSCLEASGPNLILNEQQIDCVIGKYQFVVRTKVTLHYTNAYDTILCKIRYVLNVVDLG